jgi:hypothetical protein
MRRIRAMAAGLLISAALLAGVVGATLAASAPTGARAATMVEYAIL